jgi:FtsZ-interacting cell division protein ZipA
MKWIVSGLFAIIAVAIGAWWYEGYRAESALLKQPVYRVLQKHESALFDELVAEYRVYQRDEERPEQYINIASAKISEIATHALAHASQQSQLALVQDMLATARALKDKPDDACFRFWFPKVAGPPDIARFVDARAQAHTLDLMGEAIRSAAENPVAQPAPESVKDSLADVVNATYQQFGSDAQMLAHVDDPHIDRATVCTVTIAFYDRVLQMPPDRAAALIRVMAQ